MDRATKLLRQTLVLLFINAIWAILFYAVAPAYDRSLLEIALIFVPALIILIGLLPNRYIDNFIDEISKKSQQAPKLGIPIIAIIGPVFFFSLILFFFTESLSFFQESAFAFIRQREKGNLILFSIGGGIQILFLIMTLATLLSKPDPAQISASE
jgi:hypothetical protein